MRLQAMAGLTRCRGKRYKIYRHQSVAKDGEFAPGKGAKVRGRRQKQARNAKRAGVSPNINS